MFENIFLTGIIVILLLCSWYCWAHRRYAKIIQNYGTSKSVPFLGIFFSFFDFKEFLNNWPTTIRNINSMSVFGWFGPHKPIFYTSNPDFMKKLLLSPNCNSRPDVYNILRKECGLGLLTLEGTQWSRHRKLLNPTFNHKVLMNAFPIFNEKSSNLIKVMDGYVGMEDVGIDHFLQRHTIVTSFAALMDFDLKEDNEEHMQFVAHSRRFVRLVMNRSSTLLHYSDLLYSFSKNYQPFKESKKIVFDFLNQMINDKIISQSSWEMENTKDSIDIRKTNKCFLLQAIDIHVDGIFTPTELFSEVLVFMAAGFETSATTLHTILIMLAMHPKYQEKLFEELEHFYPEKEFDFKYEDIPYLTYLDRVINETLRVAATIPSIGRFSTKDIPLADDLIIPRGTALVLDFYNMQRDERIWGPEAKYFNPDNFLPENLGDKGSWNFLPFAKGSRNCIGWRFATIFVKISLAKIIRNYRFSTTFEYKDLHILWDITLKYKVNPTIQIHRR